MEPGESSMACYQNAAVICIVIKLEPPLRLPPSFLLYLCSCLFLCIMFFSLDPISIIEIIPLLFSLPLETLLSSPFFASIFRFPCWLCHYHFGVVAHLLCVCVLFFFCFHWCFHCSAHAFVVSPRNLWFYGNDVDLFLPVMFMFVHAAIWVSGTQFIKERLWCLPSVFGIVYAHLCMTRH